MKGAIEYYSPLQSMAKNQQLGFKFCKDNYRYPTVIKNGNFIFELGEHARGHTLNIYLVKDPSLPLYSDRDHNPQRKLLSKDNALHIYGAISGQKGWNEEYGFTTNSKIINEQLQALLESAVSEYEKLKEQYKETKKQREEKEKQEYKDKVKSFETILKNESFKFIPITVEQTRTIVGRKTINVGVPNEISDENAIDYAKKVAKSEYLNEEIILNKSDETVTETITNIITPDGIKSQI